jgi:hypothetical protein
MNRFYVDADLCSSGAVIVRLKTTENTSWSRDREISKFPTVLTRWRMDRLARKLLYIAKIREDFNNDNRSD